MLDPTGRRATGPSALRNGWRPTDALPLRRGPDTLTCVFDGECSRPRTGCYGNGGKRRSFTSWREEVEEVRNECGTQRRLLFVSSIPSQKVTDETYDHDNIDRLGSQFYDEVFVPAITSAREDGKS
jgi:hypothetical protein